MKLKSINGVSFEIQTDLISVITDPLTGLEFDTKFPKTEADVVIFSQKKYEGKDNILNGFDKLVVKNRNEIFEISGAGEFEISQVLIQRPINAPYYMIDSDDCRIVYLGFDSKVTDLKAYEDLGDVEVLIAPVGNGENFVDYDTLQEIISNIEPGILVPIMYDKPGLKTKEEFLRHFGYTNFSTESILKLSARNEDNELPMQVVFLD